MTKNLLIENNFTENKLKFGKCKEVGYYAMSDGNTFRVAATKWIYLKRENGETNIDMK